MFRIPKYIEIWPAIRTNYYTVLWCHGLRAAPSPETYYALVPYGLVSVWPVHIHQTIIGLKIFKNSTPITP